MPPILTTDGGARQGPADLWCTYAAVRTLTWLGAAPVDAAATADSLRSRQNHDGGFAWQKGLPSDVWATYYSTQTLLDLGAPIPRADTLAAWLATSRHESGGYAMMPGQAPDVWATYYATRTYREALGLPVPNTPELRSWLGALQRPEGGLGWYPGSPESDTRACYYAVMAWRAACGGDDLPWRRDDLVAWVHARQTPQGGFVFDEVSDAACMWATFRAVRALDAVGAAPERTDECVTWMLRRASADGGFTRWDAYTDPDVWACFSAVGALQTLGRATPDASAVVRFLHSCELPGGGFTYRRAEAAGDSLSTAALLLTTSGGDPVAARLRGGATDWLRHAHLPYEDGVMYMPGRGAEVRCTLWAVAALTRNAGEGDDGKAAGPTHGLDADRLTAWLRRLQNRDGGFGYWHGRASDMVSTVSALEILAMLGRPASVLDTRTLADFLASCHAAPAGGYRTAPGGAVTAGSTAQGIRARYLLGDTATAKEEAAVLERHASRLGGYGTGTRNLPDLVTTYQVVSTQQLVGLPLDIPSLRRFLDKVHLADGGFAWSPLGRTDAGPLAGALGAMLATRVGEGRPLPPLNL